MVSTMIRFPLQTLVLVMLLVYKSNALVGEPKIRCIEEERQALLEIKESLYEVKAGFLSSWGDEDIKRDCCKWRGVLCTNRSGHVTTLDLSSQLSITDWPFLRGNISTSLLKLKHLTYLDFSLIDFEQNRIPSFIGKLSRLRYLNLSYTSVSGEIPSQLGNISSFRVLDLGHNYGLTTKSIGWISRLSSLTLLDLSYTSMSNATDWMQVVSKLYYLKDLKLSQCNLPNVVPSSVSLTNSSQSLAFLELSSNQLSASVWELVFTFFPRLVHLDLNDNMLQGSIPDALGNLKSLSYLSLSTNKLNGVIPAALGTLTDLEYLSLAYNELEGSIPESFRNLTALVDLSLDYNKLKGSIPEGFGNLSGLIHLNLHSNKLNGFIPAALGTLINLEYLFLAGNELEGSIPESFRNLTALVLLDLYFNKLKGSIPEGFGNLSRLMYLDLSNNDLEGEIPYSIWHLCSLRKLSADGNNLNSLSLDELTKSSPKCENYLLRELSLGRNKLNGSVPEIIGQFSQLEFLDLSENSLSGVISEAHFSKLSKLSTLYLSYNSLYLNFSRDWIPPFKLENILLDSCKLGPKFPKWLQTQKRYSGLSLSNAGISDSIPDWFWDVSSDDGYSIDLSNNNIHGTIANTSFEFEKYSTVNLSTNKLEGPIPRFLFKASELDLSGNRFSNLNALCDVDHDVPLILLDLSFNHLSGYLPDCWSPFKQLRALVLGNNKLSGKIPVSIGSLPEIETLNLGNNYFTQVIPSSIRNCKKLIAINVGENRLSGPIPTWIGENLSNLVILILRSNRFFGKIPTQLCHLTNLQLVDLSLNNISGRLPKCLHNFTAMKKSWEHISTSIGHTYLYKGMSVVLYHDKVNLVWKGTLSEFGNTLGLVKFIDLSSNKLIGQIPMEITELIELVFLNLSRNNFSGRIPLEIGNLSSLDALDLSNNHLSGSIPSSLSQVHRLNKLDLSNNNLSGKIPAGTQLQSFEPASYEGNPQLCGAPLPRSCAPDEGSYSGAPASQDKGDDDQDKFITPGFYVSLGLGLLVGFWGFFGTLIFNKTWRYSHLNFLSRANDRVYVMVAVYKAKLLRRMF